MTYFMTTLILFLMSITTGVYAFGGFHEPAPAVALALFLLFTALAVLSGTFEFIDYKNRHPSHIR